MRKHTTYRRTPKNAHHVYLHQTRADGSMGDAVWRLTIKPDGTESFGTVNNMDVASTGGPLTDVEKRRMFREAENNLGVRRQPNAQNWPMGAIGRTVKPLYNNTGGLVGVKLTDDTGVLYYAILMKKHPNVDRWDLEEVLNQTPEPDAYEVQNMYAKLETLMRKRVRRFIPWEKYDAGNMHPDTVRRAQREFPQSWKDAFPGYEEPTDELSDGEFVPGEGD